MNFEFYRCGVELWFTQIVFTFLQTKGKKENKKFEKLCSRIPNITAESFYFTQFTKQNVRAGLYPRVAVDSRISNLLQRTQCSPE